MARIEIPTFDEKEELFDFLVKNKTLHYNQKKSEDKHADAIQCNLLKSANKAESNSLDTANKIEVTSIINTTKVMDSHSDVHIDNLWKKSLRENKNLLLLQEHRMKFDHVISDQVKASADTMSWKELGFKKFSGSTQALKFISTVEKSRNEFMFDQYLKGFVKNHSVGMRYVKLFLAVNSDSSDYKEEFEVWNKYSSSIVNLKAAEEQGYFWAVTEAKVIEGSAVVKGSNPLTPTTNIEAKTFEPSENTQKSINNFYTNLI